MNSEDGRNGDAGSSVGAFPIGGPTTRAWREQALTRIAEIRTLTAVFRSQSANGSADELVKRIEDHLAAAREGAEGARAGRGRVGAWVSGAPLERAASNLHAAEADLLRLAPIQEVRSQLPSVEAHLADHLDPDDPRRARVDEIARSIEEEDLSEVDRGTVVAAVRAASSEARREVVRVRSFRNVLLVAASLLAVAAAGLAVLGIVNPDVIPLCFAPDMERVVCPTGEMALGRQGVEATTRETTSPWDVPLVELVGLIAAAVAGAAALSGIKGTSVPYSLPVALTLLKLPTGALTAVLGLLLMRGEFIPGLSALDTSGQIIAWAVVFGAAQQLFTRLVDQQAQTVLENVGKPTRLDASAE